MELENLENSKTSCNSRQITMWYTERNYAQTQFSATEFSVQGQSSDFQCMCTTHYNVYSPEKGHNNMYSPK